MVSRPVKFGTMGRHFPPIDRILEVAPKAEAQGWDYVAYCDQLMGTHPEGLLPEPCTPPDDDGVLVSSLTNTWLASFELYSAAAALTSRIEFDMEVVDVLRTNPALMAQKLVTLSHISKNRAWFGLASGEAKQFEPYGETRTKPISRWEEAIRIMDALWASNGEYVTRDSEFWPLKNAEFRQPLFEGKRPNILAVGGGPKVLSVAGELCSGWLTFLPGGVADDVSLLRDTIDTVKRRAVGCGRDPEQLEFVGQVILVLAEDDEAAWRVARSPALAWLAIGAASIDAGASWKKWGFEHPFGDSFSWSKDMRTTLSTAEGVTQLAEKIPEVVTDHTCVWGGPERVAARLQEFVDAGITRLTFASCHPWVDRDFGHQWGPLISDVMVRLGGKPLNLVSS